MENLIIIESPNKRQKVQKYSGMETRATAGHFKDLPAKELGIEIENGYKPVFVYTDPRKKKNIQQIKKLAKGKRVYIATDPDREGYAIGMMVYWELKNTTSQIYRAEIHEITEKGVKEALKKAVPFEKTNFGLFDAFLGRRVGDRIVGYILSPIASKEMGDRFSVGRVQSPAVRLVVEREREIRNFKSTPYYVLQGVFAKDITFTGIYEKSKIESKDEAYQILNEIKGEKQAEVLEVVRKKARQKPKPPFTTSVLQQTANSQLKLSPEKTMMLAQDLFENGLITYHRTDSVRLSEEYIDQLRQFIQKEYGNNYLPEKPRQYKSKNTQADAHEAIRPTAVYPEEKIPQLIKENGLSKEHEKLLRLIYRRTVASQMAEAVFDTTQVIIRVKNHKFKASGRVPVFDGFLKIYRETQPSGEEEKTETLPNLEKGGIIEAKGFNVVEKWTKPPSRYTEGSLVKKLEDMGIGRPSTYATIIKTIKQRGYVAVKKGQLYATQKGEQLIDYLAKNYPWIIDYDFTKQMEDFLDRVEERKANWREFVKNIHSKLNFYIPQKDDKPSDKQIEFAKQLAQQIGETLPEELLVSREKLSKWIDQAIKKAKDTTPPSQKQIEYALYLEEKTGIKLEKETLKRRKALEDYIKKAKQALDNQLSDKQKQIIQNHAPGEIKEALAKGDIKKAKKWLDSFFKQMKKQKKAKRR